MIKKVREQRRRLLRYLWLRVPNVKSRWPIASPQYYWQDPDPMRIRNLVFWSNQLHDIYDIYMQFKMIEKALTDIEAEEETAIKGNGKTTRPRVFQILNKKIKIAVERLKDATDTAMNVTETALPTKGKGELQEFSMTHTFRTFVAPPTENDFYELTFDLLAEAKEEEEKEREEADTDDGQGEEYRGDNYKD